jgi:polyisoprenoid-binding protein YceI
VAQFRILPQRSRVWIDARSSVHPIRSSSDGLEGYVRLELDDDGRVDLSVPPEGHLSLEASRLSSGNRLEDREMQKRIDVRRYPRIEGDLREMEPADDQGLYRVSGDVAFRGVVRRCTDKMAISRVDESTIKLAGSSRFDVRDFGLEPPRILMLKVEPEVDIKVEIFAAKEG